VTLLPQLERLDIYRLWEQGNGIAVPQSPYLALFVCPTAPTSDQSTPWISYAANAGTGTQNKADGVFLDSIGGGYNAARMNLDVISSKDGAANTLLFSEKCGSQIASQNLWSSVIGPIAGSPSVLFQCIGTGTVPSVFGIGNGLTSTIANGKIINNGSSDPAADFGWAAQPTANHPGGVVAAFADGHTVFVKDSIRPNVYAQILTSDYINASAVLMASGTGWLMNPVTTGTVPYVLQDGDY
jgi:prepilin-type processing-associated H-X9-DG protein